MAPEAASHTHDVWRFIEELNQTWVENRPEELSRFFREDIVIVHPDFEARAVGRDACMESYKEFCARAGVREFREVDPHIDVFDDTAVVTYAFDIAYELEGKLHRETGRDLFVLVREDGKWRAAWRTMLALRDGEAEA